VTVAVQLDEPGSANAAGVQTIVVSVARLVAADGDHAAAGLRGGAARVARGDVLGAALARREADRAAGLVAAARGQGAASAESNEPLPSDVKLTAPVGGLGVPASVSVTVTVQVVGFPAVADAGAQTVVVELARLAIVSVADEPLEAGEQLPIARIRRRDRLASEHTGRERPTAQLEALAPEAASTHVVAGVKAPVPSADENVIVPSGGDAVPARWCP